MMSDFAKRLRKIMDERNLDQYHLAHMIGVSQSTMSLWLNGKRNPRRTALKMLEMVEAGHDRKITVYD